jgi:Superfamily I DNA and RNA helicases
MKKLKIMTPYELGESNDKEAVKYLIVFLSNGTTNEKRLAASAINKLSSKFYEECKEAIPFLTENLSSKYPQVRQYTLKALSKFSLTKDILNIISLININDEAVYNKKIAEEILTNQLEKNKDSLGEITNEYIKAKKDIFEIKTVNKEQLFLDKINKSCSIKFTEKQKSAVLHVNGAAMVLAVPGAGKTTVLLSRTANLIINYWINPANILSITFSKAAAMDMRKRYRSIFSSLTSIEANFSTIHSFCFELIRKYSQLYKIKYKIIEENSKLLSKKSILRKCYSYYNSDKIDEEMLDELINNIGYVKNMMLKDNELEQYSNECGINNFKKIYEHYEKIKKENFYIDYDDMLTVAYDILLNDEDMLNRYRKLYKYIQVDEGQDTSIVQHKILQLLVAPKNNIFIVADDDQSIYSFRGASPKFLLQIEKLYPSISLFYIEDNFRSTGNIVNMANSFIKNNTMRFNKEIITNNNIGEPISLVRLKDEAQQADFFINEFRNLNGNNAAILYRNNLTAILLVDELSRRGEQFYLKDYNRFFFKHFVIEDIKAFMKFLINQSAIENLMKVYYKINIHISKETMNLINKSMTEEHKVFELVEKLQIEEQEVRNFTKFKSLLDGMINISPYDIIDLMENELGYGRFLKNNAKHLGYSYEGLRIIITYAKHISLKCDSAITFLNRIVELENLMQKATEDKRRKVTLSTIHSSKGLEFSHVYLVDLIENIIPNRTSVESFEKGNREKMEEERRLMYVAMTRARKKLCLVILESKNKESVVLSRFAIEAMSVLKNK